MYIKLKSGVYLIREELQKTKEMISSTQEKVNYIYILDVSGSTYNFIRGLVDDVINQILQQPHNSTASVGWFSSKGEYGWVFKGLSPSENRDAIPAMLGKYAHARNMTCFSDILEDTEKVIEDLSAISTKFAFSFYSDGFVNQNASEVVNICKRLGKKISSSMLIGYSDYYQRDIMSQMASATGGILVHASNLVEFSKHLGNFREGSTTSEPRIELDVPKTAKNLLVSFGENGEIISHNLNSEALYLAPNTKAIAYISYDKPVRNVLPIQEEVLLPTVYGVSRAALQSGDYNLALDLLAEIGDVAFIDRINNSFTVSEYGSVENDLLEAIDHNYIRFVNGKKLNYLPKEDAFCMLNLADLFASDETAKFLPYHPEFSYKKIGRSTKQKEGFPKFNAARDVAVKLNTFVWNSKKLNLGVLANIKGTIDLDAEATKVGLDRQFDTFIWRNYALISDGKLNVTKLPVKDVSEETFKALNEHDLIESANNGTLILDLTKIPLINRKIAGDFTDLNKVCRLLKKESQLEVEQKTFKYFYSLLPEDLQSQIDDLVKPTSFTDAQVAYLEKFGVKKDGSFAPETEKQEPTDFLMVKEFEFGIKGLNSIPKISEIVEKISQNKKLTTASQQAVADAIQKYESETTKASDKQKALWLKEAFERIRVELRNLRSEINRAKFAVVLGKTNFDQVPVLKEKNEYEYDGLVYEIKIKDTKVDI